MSGSGTRTASAVAHANIAFSKYWGKRPHAGNFPAVPSLSLTLDAMTTRTRVSFDGSLSADRLVLNGEEQQGRPVERVVSMLSRVRDAAGLRDFFGQTRGDPITAHHLTHRRFAGDAGEEGVVFSGEHAVGPRWRV